MTDSDEPLMTDTEVAEYVQVAVSTPSGRRSLWRRKVRLRSPESLLSVFAAVPGP